MSQNKILLPLQLVKAESGIPETFEPFDIWGFRDEFLRSSPEDWPKYFPGFRTTRTKGERVFAEWQKLLKRAMVLPPNEWPTLAKGKEFNPGFIRALTRDLAFSFEWKDRTPIARVTVRPSVQAVILSIQLDKLQEAEFKVCARPDCQEPPFRVGARSKEYCSYDCAHLMAVRSSRKRAKNKQKGSRHRGMA
jgi:hypothetical protein